MKIRNMASIIILVGFLLNMGNVRGDSTRETACFQIYKKIIMDFALEDLETATEKSIKEWSCHKKQCEKTGEYEMYLVELYCSKGDYKKCRSMSEEVIAKKGRSCDVRTAEKSLLIIDYKEGNVESSKARSETMIKKYPDWHMGYYFYGLSLFEEEKPLEAIKYLEKANALEEDTYTCGWLALLYYIEYHDYEKTLKLYEKALDLSRNVLRMPSPTLAAIDSAMHLNDWDLARNLLDYQKKVDASIVDNENYKKLSLRMDAHIKIHCSE